MDAQAASFARANQVSHLAKLQRPPAKARAQRVTLGQSRPPRQPQRQMPASRMPDRHNRRIGAKAKLPALGQKQIRRCAHVHVCSRIATTAVHATIFDIPNAHAMRAQVIGNPVHNIALCNRGLPASTMDHHNCRMRPASEFRPRRLPHINHLQGILAIADSCIRRRLWPRQQVLPHHDWFCRQWRYRRILHRWCTTSCAG